MQKTMVKR